MQKIISLVIVVLGLSVHAQKVDLDKFYFSASYRDLPRQPLDTSYHTFSVRAETGPLSKLVIRSAEVQERVRMEGWKQLNYDAHLQVQFRFEDVIIEKSDVNENVEVLKDKNGKETGRKSSFILQVTYSYGAQSRLTDYKGQAVANYTFASRDQKRVYQSEAFPSSAEANAYFKYGLLLITNQLIKQSLNESINNLNYTLTLNYGYPQRTANDFFWVLNSRKHPEYENQHRVWIDFKQAITSMSADESVDEVKQALGPVIEYYNKVKKIYNSSSKADKKLRYASCYNLAKIYWYLDDPDAAMREANELMINGYDSKDGNRLEAAATDLKLQLRLAKRNTRHFKLNPDEYQGIGYGGQ